MPDKSIAYLIPGPVSVPQRILKAMCHDSDTGHIEADFIEEYQAIGRKLGGIMGTQNDVLLMSGEAMVVLWGALKSCLKPADRLLCIGTGVFGAGFADMGKMLGCEVRLVSFAPDSTINSPEALARIDDAVKDFAPKMISAVHCDTPSGTLNPLDGLAEIKARRNVPLLAVDAVSSIGAVPIKADEWHIDILMGGSQKALSAPPCMGFASVSPRAWEEIKKAGYQGYDAFMQFAELLDGELLPYTPFRQGAAALNEAASMLLEEGLENVFARHEQVAEFCRRGVKELGLEIFPQEDAISAPCCTAVKMPKGCDWRDLRARMIARGLFAGGGIGFLNGKLFRLGHMGSQADKELVQRGLDILAELL